MLIFISVKTDRTDLFDLLLELGADINVKNSAGETAYDMAVDNHIRDILLFG